MKISRQQIEHLFSKHARSGADRLSFDEFRAAILSIEGNCQSEEEIVVLFQGVDIDGDKSISKSEFIKLIESIANGNEIEITKILFRSCDVDRNGTLDQTEVLSLFKRVGINITPTILNNISRFTKENSINYANFYKIIYDKNLSHNTDPYDGKNPKTLEIKKETQNNVPTSSCCLIL